jgi:hypothetical protein
VWPCFEPDISSYYWDYLCKSLDLWKSYGLDTNILYNRLCKFLISKCDLDLGGRAASVVLDISSHYCDYLCQIIQNSLNYEEVLDRKQNMPYNRLCIALTSKCDLEPGGRGLVLRMTHRLIISNICAKFLW